MYLTIDSLGRGDIVWRAYAFCSDIPKVSPCDRIVGNEIISGGYASFLLDRIMSDRALGRISDTNDPSTAKLGSEVQVIRLRYGMIQLQLNGQGIIMCGDSSESIPKEIVDANPCGA